jgi:hypothetical protein
MESEFIYRGKYVIKATWNDGYFKTVYEGRRVKFITKELGAPSGDEMLLNDFGNWLLNRGVKDLWSSNNVAVLVGEYLTNKIKK